MPNLETNERKYFNLLNKIEIYCVYLVDNLWHKINQYTVEDFRHLLVNPTVILMIHISAYLHRHHLRYIRSGCPLHAIHSVYACVCVCVCVFECSAVCTQLIVHQLQSTHTPIHLFYDSIVGHPFNALSMFMYVPFNIISPVYSAIIH